ncbi:MAG: FAD-binding domain-containing protein [Bdellovibrionaceae bacterium]|jgi:deoxyribodipyrimidine photo-lyase|nr:FAD-binding domain-containing protein [Pseudobdellovibrionaceae bacterium]
MIDACMRYLRATGWLNFRMRAMLMSFASYQLWLHWKQPALHLARLFVDFEPGIHYPQVQMQSGVTGINTIRIYQPYKQAQEQDPQASFIKTWCPELAGLEAKDAWAPERIPPLMRELVLPKNYPPPIVDPEKSYLAAKEKIFQALLHPLVSDEAQKVYLKHGSRKKRS